MTSQRKNIIGNLIAILLGIVLVTVLLFALECFLTFRAPSAPKDNHKDFIIPDPVLGRKIKANYSGRHRLRIDGEEIFSVQYDFDKYNRRVTPVQDQEERHESALFFGCSFTFGFGVAQGDTLPAAFSRECDTFLSLNFGNPGYGPQHMWVQLQQPLFSEQISHEKGLVLFGFMDDHLNRLMGEMNLIANWGSDLPWLDISEEEVDYRGLMEDRESFLSRIRQKVLRRHLGRFILNRIGLLPMDTFSKEEACHTFAHLFADIKRRIQTVLPGYELVVFAYPGAADAPEVEAALKEYDIPFFDYSQLHKGREEGMGYFFGSSSI